MKKRKTVVFLALLAFLGASMLFFALTHRSLNRRRAAKIAFQALQAKAHPALRGASSLGNSGNPLPQVKSWTATNTTEIYRGCLDEKVLAPLRAAFAAPRIRADSALPRNRQVLLAGRRIIVPERRAFPDKAGGAQSVSPRGTTPFIVMFNRSVQERWSAGLPGVTVRGYLPNNAWLAELTPEGLKNVATLPEAQAAEEWMPQDKLAPFLRYVADTQKSRDAALRVTIQAFEPAEAGEVAKAVRDAGGAVVEITQGTKWGTVKAALPIAAIQPLAKCGEVQWMEETPVYRTLNMTAALPQHLNVTDVWGTLGLTGKGQIVGHADTGIDTGVLSTLHPDFTNNILTLIAMGRTGDPSDTNGHGTHTAGSLVGDGSASGGKIKGMAWQAKLVHQSVLDGSGNFVSFDMYSLFNATYGYGAKIHSDSWGVSGVTVYGTYDTDCQSCDMFTWDHPDFLPVFAAGNSGTDNNADGVIDTDSIDTPATAKNVLTVGASECDRAPGSGGYSGYRWALFNGATITADTSEKRSLTKAPINLDFIGQSADTNHQGIAAFSSRGPTDDGRIKPDVVAPGADVLSCKSSLASSNFTYQERYCFDIGTSMSTPLAAGCAALVRQYLVENTVYTNPSAALVKAMLLGGAKSLAPGQYGTNQYQEIPLVSPNNVEGWGQVNVGQTVSPTNNSIRLFDRFAVEEGTTNLIRLTVVETNRPLDIVLDWIDYPAMPGAAIALVNDLDLLVTGPDGTRYYPNGGTNADLANTAESVRLANAPTGTYTIVISGAYVPHTGGVSALYARGAFDVQDENFRLTTRLVDASTSSTLGENLAWYARGAKVSTVTAADYGFVGDAPYGFCGWFLDGVRQPDAASKAQNPVTGIVMDTNHLAEARYLPFWQDANNNSLSDWWEQRYFGSNQSALTYDNDTDGDGWPEIFESLDNTDPRDAASVPTLPRVTVYPLDAFQTAHPPWAVTAVITDNFTIAEAYLFWKEKSATNWTYTAMNNPSGAVFTASVVPENDGRERVDYFVYASDLCGYYFKNFAVTSAVYHVIGDFDAPWMSLAPASFPLLQMTGGTTNLGFTVKNRAGPDLVWTALLAEASAPFAETNGWTHSGNNDAWHLSTNRTWDSAAVWYCGNDSTRLYANGCDAVLDAPAFTVGAKGGFFYRQWIQTEYDTDQKNTHFWDGGVVKVSTNGGASFAVLTPIGGYPASITSNPVSPFVAEQPCFGAQTGTWQTVRFDLSAYEGKSVIVRFEFGSDYYTVDEGWYIADVTPYRFNPDAAAPAWLVPQDALGGTLADGWASTHTLAVDSSRVVPDTEVSACLKFVDNDPADASFYLLTLQRGYLLTAEAIGPGTVSTNTAFLFKDIPVTVDALANSNAYLYAELLNGLPQARTYTYQTVADRFTFRSVESDQTLAVYFTPRLWTLTIVSQRGSPVPAVGQYTVNESSNIAASVTTPIMLNASSKIRYACTGWTLEGVGYAQTGTTSSVVFSLTNSATLTWLWSPELFVSMTVKGNGSVQPPGAWCLRYSSVVFTAVPDPYYHFVSWGGSSIGVAVTNGLTLTDGDVEFPDSFTATFAANLTATHGVPEWWLGRYGFHGDFDAAAEGDADGDGFATWKEWCADTDPTNALSLLTFLNLSFLTPTNPFAMWIGGSAATQYVERAETPSGPWAAFYTNLPPTALTNSVRLPYLPPSGFYRITVPRK